MGQQLHLQSVGWTGFFYSERPPVSYIMQDAPTNVPELKSPVVASGF